MCGRYALYGPTSRVREQFDLDDGFDFGPRYNIAPTTKVLIVQAGPHGERAARLHRWGLIPSWAGSDEGAVMAGREISLI